MPTHYDNEINRCKDKSPTREEVILRALDHVPDLIEKVVEGRSLEHPIGVLTALCDIMRDQRKKTAARQR